MTNKKLLAIINKVTSNNARINAIKEEIKPLYHSDEKLIELCNEEEILKIENKILKDNARIVVFNAVLPVVVETLKKYQNKPYGEKTRDKMSTEIKNKTGCDVYFTSEEFTIYPRGEKTQYFFRYNDLDVRTNYDRNNNEYLKILIDNKVQAQPEKIFHLCYCGEYVQNAKNRAKQIVKRFASLKEKEMAFEKECNSFNELLPSSIDNIYPRNFRNYLMSSY